MVAAHHGLRSDLATLRQRFSLSLKGATLGDLVRIAGALQLNARPLRAELEHLPQLHLPCILHWDLNHFVVLTACKAAARGASRDPRSGARRASPAARRGVAPLHRRRARAGPGAGFEPRTERQHIGLRQLLGPVRGCAARSARCSCWRWCSSCSCCSGRSSCSGWSTARC
jgi:ATP-binding cassette subfamily B protein RaxB